MATPPVLHLLFNRPDLARQSFEPIRRAQPSQLFISVDGPRPDHEGEDELCRQCREIAEMIDWPCEVHTQFRQENLGLRYGVNDAITWFFERVESGVIIEDDVVLDDSFFPFAAELLERYRANEKIMAITAFVHGNPRPELKISYYPYSRLCPWGWATWARAWKHQDIEMSAFPQLDKQWFIDKVGDPEMGAKDYENLRSVYTNEVSSWAFPWKLARIRKGGITLKPTRNLALNIGFDERATHTTRANESVQAKPLEPMPFPLVHPNSVEPADIQADVLYYQKFVRSLPPQPPPLAKRLRKLPNKVLQWTKRRLGIKPPLPSKQ